MQRILWAAVSRLMQQQNIALVYYNVIIIMLQASKVMNGWVLIRAQAARHMSPSDIAALRAYKNIKYTPPHKS